MEEKNLRNYGMELLSSSELVNVRGGISLPKLKLILDAIAYVVDFIGTYGKDFREGFEEGWNM